MSKVFVEYLLYDGMNTEGQLFRVKKANVVRFILDVSLIGKEVRFFINYPVSNNQVFKRNHYTELKLCNPTIAKQSLDCFDNYFQLTKLHVCGSYHFYFSTNGTSPESPVFDNSNPNISGSGYLIVDPHFTRSVKTNKLDGKECYCGWDLSGVVMQSYLSKNLGIFSQWESRLFAAKAGNYNMIHFTPLQELGYSRSAYSLRDQLKVNPEFTDSSASKAVDWDDIEKFIRYIENDWSILSMSDLVFNHTSNDSPWLHKHPECAYNVVNSPHLAPAYLLDHIIWRLTVETSLGLLESQGIPPTLKNPDQELGAMYHWLSTQIEDAKLYEFFLADVESVVREFYEWLLSTNSPVETYSFTSHCDTLCLEIAGPRKGLRFGATVAFELARKQYNREHNSENIVNEIIAKSASEWLKTKLFELNGNKSDEIRYHLRCAIDNVLANAKYRFYDPHGMKLGTVTLDSPIMWAYFYHPIRDLKTTKEAEKVLESIEAQKIMAFNGWVINDDPMRNFAESNSFVYLRRELIVWGDSVKLRYGENPEDCPYLWDHMAKYAELTARIFHAVRLDNCHSTPLRAAQYMLDRARAVRPDLYVVAELFTGGEYVDNIFINKLGINSLIRESLSTKDCRDLGSKISRYGVLRPAGAFFDRPGRLRIYPSMSHAVMYDQTHDNPSVLDAHSVFDYLPLAAIGSFACCAVGSTRGCDELVPHYVNVVTEERKYAKWPEEIDEKSGMIQARSILNEIHQWLSIQCFTETYIDQITDDITTITRFCPETREAVILVAHSAFRDPGRYPHHYAFKTLNLNGRVNKLLCEVMVTYNGEFYPPQTHFKENPQYINGVKNVNYSILQNVSPKESRMFNVESHNEDSLVFHNFPPGSIAIVSFCLNEPGQLAIANLHKFISEQFQCRLYEPRESQSFGKGDNLYIPLTLQNGTSDIKSNHLRTIMSNLSLIDLNKIMFRCGAEECADAMGINVYQIPNYGALVYCGFQSIADILVDVRDKNDLGHPVCDNLRQGDWLAHYFIRRLQQLPKNSKQLLTDTICELGQLLQSIFTPFADLPRYLVPAYFEILITKLSELLNTEVILRMSPWIRTSSSVVKRLAVATTQFYGFIGNSRIPSQNQHSSTSSPPMPIFCSLAAGLPHFAEGMWRSWGRDTFISLRGCLLLTGRFQDAATLILSYASLMRHGLIPNLIGDGYQVKPRYNCRDSVWFWLYSIVCYETLVQESNAHGVEDPDLTNRSILNENVWRWFPTDDAKGWPDEADDGGKVDDRMVKLHEVMQNALQTHASRISFTERNAGPHLDEHMRPDGFKIEAFINPETGFPQGGNAFNCGTWMDKMGSSEKAGNRGIPATPRDGSAVELVGLAYAVVSWLAKSTNYPHKGVQFDGSNNLLLWKDWEHKLKSSFEPNFWIPNDTNDPGLIYNRGIYRDSVNSSAGFTDNQLRPNFLVAMAVAPNLFTPERAWAALEIARERLVGPLGMRTLSKDDLAYRGYYNNSDDSFDYSVARGFNYHQGPEWLWPMGYYLRARIKFAHILNKSNPTIYKSIVNDVNAECQCIIARLDNALKSSVWRSLPELTNAEGQVCKDSCEAQAWSVGCILEAVYELIDSENN